MTERVPALDMAKGTAIVLVVIGHVVSRNNYAPGAEWYLELRRLIYLFHMPLFMALSGMALGLSWRHRASASEVGRFVALRVRQFALPFVAMGVLVVGGKLLAAHWVHVDNPPASLAQGLAAIVLTPMQSPSAFLWYIQVLAVYYLVVPWLLQWSARWAGPALLLAGLALASFSVTPVANLDQAVAYLPFFAAGLLLGRHWSAVAATVITARSWPLWAWLFLATLGVAHLIGTQPKWLVGALSIPFVLAVHQTIRGGRLLTFLGGYTLSIYLFNTIAIGLAKAALLPLVPYRGHFFLVYLVVLTVAGLLAPILLKRVLAGRWPRLGQYL